MSDWVLPTLGIGICATALAVCGVPGQDPPGDAARKPPAPTERKAREENVRESTERKVPRPPASRERIEARKRMVNTQMAHPPDGRDAITSKVVLEALRTVPRHVFVPENIRGRAHADSPLPIGHGQTISQPYIVAWMSELLELKRDAKVLEIGTGSGYQAAVLAHLTPRVHTIEIIEALHKRAKKVLEEQKYTHVKCRRADGYLGWPEEAPFDAIIVTCAAGHLPPPLWKQLKPGGRIVIPIGGPYEVQRLVVVTKTAEGKRRSKTIAPVRFVPLTRAKR